MENLSCARFHYDGSSCEVTLKTQAEDVSVCVLIEEGRQNHVRNVCEMIRKTYKHELDTRTDTPKTEVHKERDKVKMLFARPLEYETQALLTTAGGSCY